ncbi:unnamed protein product [Acanthocheilonema viteae]|uniref:Uncharacterized protein n=1 Tax=Acanthocheilonema viteae TaxID=6277 RepID=A0A498SXV6_ACAVI|nr:unnamed protein product [Acanthocheilonema viteae]
MQSMQTKGAHGKNQTSDDRMGLIGTEQLSSIISQNFHDEKGSPLLFSEDNSMVINSMEPHEKRRRRRKRRRTLDVYFCEF